MLLKPEGLLLQVHYRTNRSPGFDGKMHRGAQLPLAEPARLKLAFTSGVKPTGSHRYCTTLVDANFNLAGSASASFVPLCLCASTPGDLSVRY